MTDHVVNTYAMVCCCRLSPCLRVQHRTNTVAGATPSCTSSEPRAPLKETAPSPGPLKICYNDTSFAYWRLPEEDCDCPNDRPDCDDVAVGTLVAAGLLVFFGVCACCACCRFMIVCNAATGTNRGWYLDLRLEENKLVSKRPHASDTLTVPWRQANVGRPPGADGVDSAWRPVVSW